MHDYQCLMIETKDHRKFFTHEKNYSQLLEFSELFNAEISIVKVNEAEILDLEQLAPAICNSEYDKIFQYQLLEVKITQQRQRKKILITAKKIKAYIEAKFIRGDIVSLKGLKEEFHKNKFTDACLCNHLAQVRTSLEKKGHKIAKVGGGKYKITSN